MQFLIDGTVEEFTDLKTLRAACDLPDEFGVHLFEPKDYTGLGRIDSAGAELKSLHNEVLGELPSRITLQEWLHEVDKLQIFFWQQLVSINHAVGLREVEIDFAAAGFGDVCRAVVYALIHAQARAEDAPPFSQIYTDWLFSTIKLSGDVHSYTHQGSDWAVQVISHAYGRMGLKIDTGEALYFVYDGRLACPAEGYMQRLLNDVADHIIGTCI